MQPDLTRDRFIELAASYAVVPLSVEVLADRETAVSVFEKLIGAKPGFLLESVEGGVLLARWSFVGGDPVFTLVAREWISTVEGRDIDLPTVNPLQVLEFVVGELSVPSEDVLG